MASAKIPLGCYGSTAGRDLMAAKSPRAKTLTVDTHNHMRVPTTAGLEKPDLPKDHHTPTKVSNLDTGRFAS